VIKKKNMQRRGSSVSKFFERDLSGEIGGGLSPIKRRDSIALKDL
jgi:hypothetical protein